MGSNVLSLMLCIIALFLGGFAILLEILVIKGLPYEEILFVYLPIILLAIGLLAKIFSKD